MRFFRRRSRNARDAARTSKSDLMMWWETEFNEEERNHILSKYQPLGLDSDMRPSIEHIIGTDGRAQLPLSTLATWFASPPSDLPLARRIIDKAVALGEGKSGQILDRHFVYQSMITVYYRDRNRDPAALELAIEACNSQIALGEQAARAFFGEYPSEPLPTHIGFKQLAIIREKQKDFAEAIRIAHEALRQGWSGDWEKRIGRCRKRMET